jgi:CheY-like chemotaxis protein
VWDTVPLNQALPTDADAEASKMERNLEAISPKPRQAFLLCSVEGFSRKDAAQILGVADADVNALLNQAGEELAKQLAADILIIEDEPLVAEDLEATIRDIGHRATGVARTHKEALTLVAAKRPSLVMADIHLADGSSGIEAVDEILKSLSVPVIFVTGHPELLLTGTKPEPVFLLPKPFDPVMLKALISQALFFGMASTRTDKHAA